MVALSRPTIFLTGLPSVEHLLKTLSANRVDIIGMLLVACSI